MLPRFKAGAVLAVLLLTSGYLFAPLAMASNRIDTQRPDAPELAAYGELNVGVQPIHLVNPNQIDIVAIDPAAPVPDPLPLYDRPLTVELWYPADPTATGSTTLRAFIRDGETEVNLEGQAVLYAAPIRDAGSFPLVIISHGYPGNRFLLSHLADNLASKGYVVASIDHTDSTYRTQAAFGSTLVNRSLDHIFVLNEIERLNQDSAHFLHGLVDTSRTAIVGYSMGGYGALITAGAGVTEAGVNIPFGAPHGLLGVHRSGSASHEALIDARIRTIIAFGPWGRHLEFWDAETMPGIQIPMLVIAGSKDDVSDYDNGIRPLWEEATNSDRALLSFEFANHNAAAPYPAPRESYAYSERLGFAPFGHYADAVWDTVRMNNIAQHFATAWLGKHLKGEADKDAYLHLVPVADDGVYSVAEDGSFTDEHTYWTGFEDRSAKGLRYETLSAGELSTGE